MNQTKFRKMYTPEEIKSIASEVYENIWVLGIYDQEDNYIQIPIEEAKEIKKA